MSSMARIRKSSLYALGIAAGAGLSQIGQAQTFSLIAGGSSALIGTINNTTSFRQGAVPLAIQNLIPVANYKAANTDDDTNNVFVTSGSIKVTGDNGLSGANTENISQAEIRYIGSGTTKRIIIILRSDSGNGVRYIANSAQINDWTGVTFYKVAQNVVQGTAAPTAAAFTAVTPNAAGTEDQKTLAFVVSNAGANERIDTGFSDVTGDTVANYANFALFNTAGLGALVGAGSVVPQQLAVQTLLPLYNKDVHTKSGQDFKVNFTRDQFRGIINGAPGNAGLSRGLYWSQIDPRLKNGANEIVVGAAYRETSSGTRLTQLLNVQRYGLGSNDLLSEATSGFIIGPNQILVSAGPPAVFAGGANPQTSTGAVTGAVNHNPGTVGTGAAQQSAAIFGYAFLTGAVSSSLSNIRVGLYNGVAPYKAATTATAFNGLSYAPIDGASLPLPGVGGQVSYDTISTTGPYYTETINGRYQLWSTAVSLTNSTVRNTATATDPTNGLAALIRDSSVQQQINALGLVQISQMGVGRTGFLSSLTGEIVTDGNFITYGPDAYGLVIE